MIASPQTSGLCRFISWAAVYPNYQCRNTAAVGDNSPEERREPGEVGVRCGRLQQDEKTEEQDQREEVLWDPNREERERRTRSKNSVEGEGVGGDVQAEIVTPGKPESKEETQGRSNL
ncbi:hypothetical protein NDU88_006216 [Pleurodeles waltl]|uniref:Uncharacterized protein n=1 Tax=Pleurodeles waltl TaxID=8319 RepID=A0AAV7QI34_PLEWA|nr:hypothetical protein NDU88_006216 [Pleurodeles waltl]